MQRNIDLDVEQCRCLYNLSSFRGRGDTLKELGFSSTIISHFLPIEMEYCSSVCLFNYM